MADQERPESLEPEGVPQEEIRRLNKANEDVVAAQENPLPEQLDLPPSEPVMDALTEITSAEVPEVAPAPLEPIASRDPAGVLPVVPSRPVTPSAPIVPNDHGMDDLRRIVSQENRKARAEAVKARRMSPEAAQKKQAEHGKAMADVKKASAAAGGGVLDEPLEAGVGGGMARGDAERLFFRGREGADGVVEAYKAYIDADRERWSELTRLLKEHQVAINDLRQQMSRMIGAVERNCI